MPSLKAVFGKLIWLNCELPLASLFSSCMLRAMARDAILVTKSIGGSTIIFNGIQKTPRLLPEFCTFKIRPVNSHLPISLVTRY